MALCTRTGKHFSECFDCDQCAIARKLVRANGCEMDTDCKRETVGTVRIPSPEYPHGSDLMTCTAHARGNVIWYYGKRSPYAKVSAR